MTQGNIKSHVSYLCTHISVLIFQVSHLISHISNHKSQISSLTSHISHLTSQIDVWNTSAIGIDDNTDTIYYTRSAKDQEITEMIKLTDIQKCQYIKNSKSGGGHDGGFRATDTLELAFIYRDRSKGETVLEMYNAAYDPMTLTVELQLAQKWSEIANDMISGNK